MKAGEILIVLVVLGFLSFIIYDGCNTEHKKQHWVITGKEYQQGGMCCDNNRQNKFYGVVMPVAHTTQHHHHYEPSKFIIHIGKPYCNDLFETDSLSFYTKYRVTQRILY